MFFSQRFSQVVPRRRLESACDLKMQSIVLQGKKWDVPLDHYDLCVSKGTSI